MPLAITDTTEAVVLFSGGKITRELLYPEFEAILDGFVPVPDFKGSTARAVYLVINSNLFITAAVFFVLDFDAKGMADRRWNVPLQHLADISGKGPDMGAGPIRLSCFSQCAIGIHQDKLWDPQMDAGNNSFVLLKKAVQNNRMGLIFKSVVDETAPPPASVVAAAIPNNEKQQAALQKKLHEHYSTELRDKLASAIKEHRLRIATLHSKHQEIINKLQHEHQSRLQVFQDRIKKMSAEKSELEARNQSLKESFDIQASKVEGLREYYSHKLKAAELDETNNLNDMQENFAIEMELKVQAATAELREMLEMREVELFYRHENEAALKEEIVTLKHLSQDLLNNSGEQLLQRLNKAGVNFVVYHPGVGQFTIEQSDLSQYLNSPTAYVAKKAGVGEKLFTQWFVHYQNPICVGTDSSGHNCSKPVVRIGSPLEFHEGESDRCEHHQLVSYKMVAGK